MKIAKFMKTDIPQEKLTFGKDFFFASDSPVNNYSAVFEDDTQTGYFYAVDRTNGQEILTAVNIYNVSNLTDGDKPSELRIVWDETGQNALLLINNYPHALFDFISKKAFCRSAFPKGSNGWSTAKWNDSLLNIFDN
jgi:hypothetical protein